MKKNDTKMTESNNVLRVRGRMSLGYGVIPKLAMKDPKLPIEAKAIYSYFCSYAGAGTTAFPRREKILRDLAIGKDRFTKYLDILKAAGYVSVKQENKSNGKFSHNVYTLNEVIEAPCPQNKDTAPCPDFPDTDNKDTINNRVNNNNAGVISKNIDMTDMTDARAENIKPDECRETIRGNISYEFIKNNWHKNDTELVDELVEAMLDVICSDGLTVRIGGSKKPKELVASRYLSLNLDDIEYVINNFRNQRNRITNISGYLKTMLYNVKHEISHKYENEAAAMFHG